MIGSLITQFYPCEEHIILLVHSIIYVWCMRKRTIELSIPLWGQLTSSCMGSCNFSSFLSIPGPSFTSVRIIWVLKFHVSFYFGTYFTPLWRALTSSLVTSRIFSSFLPSQSKISHPKFTSKL